MLELTIPKQELLTSREEFVSVPETYLKLEHSLISVKHWEEKWHIPFLDKSKDKTPEQLKDYIKCMTINTVNPIIFDYIPKETMAQIAEYIENPMTATWFSDTDSNGKKKTIQRSNQILTAELIYYYMILFNIPVEFQKWHLNQLITLIRVCKEEEEARNGNAKKQSAKDIARSNAELNAYRRKMLNSKG